MKTYTIKPEYLHLWGPDASEETTVSEAEVSRLASEWGMEVSALLQQLDEIERKPRSLAIIKTEEEQHMNIWYAVLMNREDTDWGTGSFDWAEAVEMAKKYGEDAIIAEIDGGYDEEGNPTTDPVCIAEHFAGRDF